MDGLRTRGQPVAVAAIRAMLGSGLPHAVLLVGPEGVGKTTLALDIAAALLCQGPVGVARPCRDCRACRMVEHDNHPDLHRLAPTGPGGSIPIGGRDDRGVRDLVGALAYLPVEGGARVAIVERAHRMSEDAQSAFLKTLEEPPARTTIILCADDDELLLPTIRSRCARIRLGAMGPRDVEAVLVEHGVADAPTASRLARMTDGRPGHAIAFARAPQAVIIRAEIARTLLDLLGAGLAARLVGVRELAARAAALIRELDSGAARAAMSAPSGQPRSGRPPRAGRIVALATTAPTSTTAVAEPVNGADLDADGLEPAAATSEPGARVPAAERRRAALMLLDIWRATVRDLGLVVVGEPRGARDTDLLDDLVVTAKRLDEAAIGSALRRLDLAAERLDGNVGPELVLDVLAIRWAPPNGR